MPIRHRIHGLAIGVVACAMAVVPGQARAQDDAYDNEDRPALVLYAHGGMYNPLAHLDDGKNVDFKSAFSLGGGTAYRISRNLALRGNFTWVRAEARDSSFSAISSIAGDKFNRYIFDGDLQLRYPLRGGATPYAFVGGGGVRVERDVSRDTAAFTKGAGKFGLGLGYQIPQSNVGLYIEGAGWIYKWDRNGFNKTQLDTTVSGGLSYRFGL